MNNKTVLAALLSALTLTLSPVLAIAPDDTSLLLSPPDEIDLVAPPAAPVLHSYREGRARVSLDGLWGFADPSGEVVIPIQYDSVTDFSLGTAQVEREGKVGLVRPDGLELLPPEYDSLQELGFGLYLAQKEAAWGVVSLLSFSDGAGGLTHELYPIAYTSAKLTTLGGLKVLLLAGDEGGAMVPLSSPPQRMLERQIPSAQFPLIKDRLPSYTDAGPRDWFTLWANLAYNLGLMQGVGGDRFAPNQTLTVAELVKLAAFLESQVTGDDFHLQPITASPWYSSSVAYCIAAGILSSQEFTDYERPVTRAEMVQILSRTTLGRRLPEVNSLSRVKASLPDVSPGDYAADAIYQFYSKGLLAGTDQNLTFNPNGRLTRAEAAAVAVRMARAEQRVLLWDGRLPNTMT